MARRACSASGRSTASAPQPSKGQSGWFGTPETGRLPTDRLRSLPSSQVCHKAPVAPDRGFFLASGILGFPKFCLTQSGKAGPGLAQGFTKNQGLQSARTHQRDRRRHAVLDFCLGLTREAGLSFNILTRGQFAPLEKSFVKKTLWGDS